MATYNSQVCVASKRIEIYELDDEWVIMDLEQEKVAIMNETAFFIWDYLRKNSIVRVEDLCHIIAIKHQERESKQIASDVIDTINLLIYEQFICEI